MSNLLRKQTGKSASVSKAIKQGPAGILPPELVRMIKYASYLGDGYIMLKVDTGKAATSREVEPAGSAVVRKIPGIPLITRRELCALADRLRYGSPALSADQKSTRKK